MIPTDGSVCCICWSKIKVGQHARDAEGQRWDVHQGECAALAGIASDDHQAVNPECAVGKHQNCDGYAMCLRITCDNLHACACSCHRGEEP